MLIKDFIQNPVFDVNCYIKIFDCTDRASREGKTPVYDGYGSPAYASEDVLAMELSYVTTDKDVIILEGARKENGKPEKESEMHPNDHKQKVQAALQALYDAADAVNQVTNDDDYEQLSDLLDDSANIVNDCESLGIVDDGIISL